MYRKFFDLKGSPFSLSADPGYLYMSRQHWEAMAHLMYGVDENWGFVLITGEIGTGKTTLCRLLLDQMPEDVETAFIINPKLNAGELLASICREFGIVCDSGVPTATGLFDCISAHLLEVHAKGRKALLIIDEAQYLSAEVMDQLRLLTNLETEDCKLLRIILIGQPELRDKLALPELAQMSQRITARYHINPLPEKDVASYVAHRLSVAGSESQLFTPSALRALYQRSKGIPRLINVICDRALLGACMKKQKKVTRLTLLQAADEVLRDGPAGRNFLRTADFRLIGPGLLAGMLGSLLLLWNSDLLYRYIPLKSILSASQETTDRQASNGNNISWWPPHISAAQSREDAYRILSAGKGISYYSSNPSAESTFCADMELLDMRCRDMKDSGRNRNLGAVPVPSVIRLSDSSGINVFAAFQGLNGGKVLLSLGGSELELPAEEIRSHWDGEYMTIEQSALKNIGSVSEKKSDNKKGR